MRPEPALRANRRLRSRACALALLAALTAGLACTGCPGEGTDPADDAGPRGDAPPSYDAKPPLKFATFAWETGVQFGATNFADLVLLEDTIAVLGEEWILFDLDGNELTRAEPIGSGLSAIGIQREGGHLGVLETFGDLFIRTYSGADLSPLGPTFTAPPGQYGNRWLGEASGNLYVHFKTGEDGTHSLFEITDEGFGPAMNTVTGAYLMYGTALTTATGDLLACAAHERTNDFALEILRIVPEDGDTTVITVTEGSSFPSGCQLASGPDNLLVAWTEHVGEVSDGMCYLHAALLSPEDGSLLVGPFQAQRVPCTPLFGAGYDGEKFVVASKGPPSVYLAPISASEAEFYPLCYVQPLFPDDGQWRIRVASGPDGAYIATSSTSSATGPNYLRLMKLNPLPK